MGSGNCSGCVVTRSLRKTETTIIYSIFLSMKVGEQNVSVLVWSGAAFLDVRQSSISELIMNTYLFNSWYYFLCVLSQDSHTRNGIHSDSLRNTTDSNIVPESTHTLSGTGISDIISLSFNGKSGAKLVTFLAIYIFYDRICLFL